MPVSSIEWRGGVAEPELDVDAPRRHDRPPGAGGVDERGAPRAGGDDDRAGGLLALRRADPHRAAALDDRRGGDPFEDLGAGLAGAGGEGPGGRGGRDGAAGVEAEAGEVLGERGLELVGRVERLGARAPGSRPAISARIGSSAAASSPTTSTPTVSGGSSNPWPSSA